MKEVYSRFGNIKGKVAVQVIKQALAQGEAVKLYNEHETFYGHGFGRWFKEQLADVACSIEVTRWDRYYGYESEMIITPQV